MVEDQKKAPSAQPVDYCPLCGSTRKGALPCVPAPSLKSRGVKNSTDPKSNTQVSNTTDPPADTDEKVSKKKKAKKPPPKQLTEEEKGRLQPMAASVLMKVLYAARHCRPDLLRPTNRLACFVTKWTHECDKQLGRLVQNIQYSKHDRMFGWIGLENSHRTSTQMQTSLVMWPRRNPPPEHISM